LSSVKNPQPRNLKQVVLGTMLCLAIGTLFAPPAYAGKKDKDKEKDQKEAAQAQQPAKPPVDTSKLVWPPPPDVARIRWMTQIKGEADVKPPVKQAKKKTGWMDKMAGVQMPTSGDKKTPVLGKPFGVVADSKGRIYVADLAQGAVFIFDLEKKDVQYIGDKPPFQFALPMGLAIDDTDRLFVVDSRLHQVTAISPDGKLENVFGQDKLERPIGAAVDNENRLLYVVDAKASRIAVFDADTCNFIRYVGKPSDPLDPQEGTLSTPLDAAVDLDGNLYVTDTLNDRVQIFDADGEFINVFGKQGDAPGSFMRAKGIAVDPDGHVYVTDAEFNNVQVFDKEGHFLAAFGEKGDDPGQFTLITGIYVDKKNRILIADQWHGRVQVLRYITEAEAAPDIAKRKQALAEKEAAREASAADADTIAPADSTPKKPAASATDPNVGAPAGSTPKK
jgi:DNA-binding beta-propeller fold protein YncE